LCQQMKNQMEEVAGKLKLEEVPEKPWTHISVDFITKLPIVAGKDAILVVYDRLSKIMHFVATTEGTTVEGLARSFRDNVVMECFGHEQFSFLFLLFSDFIGILFSFSFSFLLDNEEACDIEVT